MAGPASRVEVATAYDPCNISRASVVGSSGWTNALSARLGNRRLSPMPESLWQAAQFNRVAIVALRAGNQLVPGGFDQRDIHGPG